MKINKRTKSLIYKLVICAGLLSSTSNAQNVGINTTGATPNAKAMLDIDVSGASPKSGLLVPRMTTAERNAITAPIPESLLIYNTTTQCFEAWNQSASIWVTFGCIGCSTPSAPVAHAGTSIGLSGFTANWGNVTGAASYLLDVSTSPSFSSFVSGYNALNVGSGLASSVSSLTCAATYYYRVRATNACGTSVSSNTITVVTPACPTPTSGICGSQIWMAANINVGNMVAGITNQSNNGIIEKYCYNDLPANCTTYGGLYQWDEAMNYTGSINCDPCGASGRQGICPTGYHIPTDLEWSRYEHCLENNIAPVGTTPLSDFQTIYGLRGSATPTVGVADKLKVDAGYTPAWDGANASGFAALPGGFRTNAGGGFGSYLTYAYFWTSTEDSSSDSWFRFLYSTGPQAYRIIYPKTHGLSVRCIQN